MSYFSETREKAACASQYTFNFVDMKKLTKVRVSAHGNILYLEIWRAFRPVKLRGQYGHEIFHCRPSLVKVHWFQAQWQPG